MQKDFISKWKNADRKGRKKILCDFIAAKRRQKTNISDTRKKISLQNKPARKPVLSCLPKIPEIKRHVLAFCFSSSSDSPTGARDDNIQDSGGEDQPPKSSEEPSRKSNMNVDKGPEIKKDKARQDKKQLLIKFIEEKKKKKEIAQKQRLAEKEAKKKLAEEARRQAQEKLAIDAEARRQAKQLRQQELLKAKIEREIKAKAERQAKIEAKQKEKEAIEKSRQAEIEERKRLVEEALKLRKQKKELLLAYLNGIRSKREIEEKQRLAEKEARKKLAEEARRQAQEKLAIDAEARRQAKQLRQQELLKAKIEREIKAKAERQAKIEAKKISPKVKPPDIRPEKRKKLLSFINDLKAKYQQEVIRQKIAKDALKKQKEIAALALKQERQAKAIQAAEFSARKKQIELQKKELLKTELLLAAKRKAEAKAVEKTRKEYEKQIKDFSSKITGAVSNVSKLTGAALTSAISSITPFVKKAQSIKIPAAEKFAKPEIVPAEVPAKAIPAKAEKAKKYREPVKIGPLLRKNAFRILFFLLLLMWLGEILFYSLRWRPPREKFEEMFGSEETKSSKTGSTEITEAETKIAEYKIPSINIEGKRDPFSSGLLTMELMKKPKPTEIVKAYQPEIITISRAPSIVSSSVQKPVREKAEKITPILKPEKPEPATATLSEATTTKILPPAPVSKPEVSPLIVPQIECNLIYRGSLIMEGIEYIFLEGKQRTYRVTVGDVVEGFRILKKEKGVLTLSKEGVIIEIPAE